MRIWLDDERPAPSNYDRHVKTASEAIVLLKTGQVKQISFDHDLGNKKGTGYTVASWVEEQAYNGKIAPFCWSIHSSNPVGRANILAVMQKVESMWRDQGLL